jgi:ferritin-like metal-binding protein YciE
MVKVIPPSRQTPENTRVNDSSRMLKRFYVAERQIMRALAGWFIQTSPVEIKFQMAGDMWQTSRNADLLRTRVLELRYPRRDVDKKYDPDVIAFTEELMKAQTLDEFLAGLYQVALPALLAEYRQYLSRTDSLNDAPTVYALRHIIADKEAMIERMNDLALRDLPASTAAWCDYLGRWLASIGGFSGTGQKTAAPADAPFAGRPAFSVPKTVRRDERFKPAHFHLPHENKYDKAGAAAWKRFEALDKRVAMQVWSAISHFNEIWAAEVPCSVMFELKDEVWDFYLDLARWAWDEARHSMMGYRALQGWGFDVPALIPYGSALYNAQAPMPAKQRLALLYYYEEGLLRSGTKQTEIKILESAGDEGSTHDMDYDWADEAIHVGYGFRWLRHLLGDDSAGQEELKRLTDEAREVMAAYVLAHKDDPEAPLAPYFDRLYEVVSGMTFEIEDDGLEINWAPVVADESVLEDL